MNRLSSLLLLAAVALSGTVAAGTPCDDLAKYPVRFAILGDRTGDHHEGVYGEVVTEVARMRPDFVMTVGDMIEGYTSDTTELRKEWNEYLALVKPLTMPIHYSPGNHDITYDGMEPTFRERIGAPYYSFDRRGVHIVVMDNSRSESFEEIPKEQIDWLKSDLSSHEDACYTLVFMHKPFWYRTLGAGEPDPLHEIFKAHGVDAVFTGHFHEFFTGDYDGIKYTSFGSSGADALDRPKGFQYQFGWVTIDGDGVHPVAIKKDAVGARGLQPVEELRAANRVGALGLAFAEPLTVDAHMHGADGIVRVRLSNEMGAAVYADTLRWTVPEGWKIDPASAPFEIAPHGATEVTFAMVPGEQLFPLPEASTRLPYGEDKTETVRRSLEIARTFACAPAGGPVAIDGALDESCWRAAPVSILYGWDNNVSPQDSTAFYFAYDKANLYMAVYCHEAVMDSMRAVMTDRDDKVFTEEAVGLMLAPDPEDGVGYQVYTNPLGTVYDQQLRRAWDGYWNGDSGWNGEYEVKTTRGADYYIIEMRIPLAQVGVEAKSGDRWRVNFRRKQSRLNSAAALQNPWSYNPNSFGRLIFQ